MRPLLDFRNCLRVLILLALCPAGVAQSGEFLPEIDAYFRIRPDLRLWLQAKETYEGGTPVTAELGPSLEYTLKSRSLLSTITNFDTDRSKASPAVFSLGYRYLPYPGSPPTNRLEPVLTLNAPLRHFKALLSDRNRFDLDWQNGGFQWRYRNRLQLQRTWRIGSYHLSPYASAEFYYESLYAKWADTALSAGCSFPIRKHFDLNPYYEHQNQTGTSPNQQYNQFGLMLNLFFPKH